ncbi:MAG: DMT family transporter [Verrucomicrobiota bacterium]|jgi:drug/metabolite transporter (DMT)-like permease|nr:DMT family transporter [Verrucomicrobiota bacterium]MEE2615436.1 DMT family transporter [Verrucomicrobiota bacterium]
MSAAILATILFSLSAVSGKRLSHYLTAVEANMIRFIISALLLGTYSSYYGLGLGGGAFGMFFISGVIGFGVGDYGLFRAYKIIGSRLTMVMTQCLAAPFAATVEWLWLGSVLSLGQVLAGVGILVGVCLALVPNDTMQIDKANWKKGIFWGLLSAFGQGFGAVLSRKAGMMLDDGVSIDGLSAAYQRVLGGLAVMLILFIGQKMIAYKREDYNPRVDLDSASVKWIFMLVLANALCGPTLGVGAYQWALNVNDLPAGIVLSVVALSPLVIIPFSMKFEGERPTFRSLIGSVIAVVGVVIMTNMVEK